MMLLSKSPACGLLATVLVSGCVTLPDTAVAPSQNYVAAGVHTDCHEKPVASHIAAAPHRVLDPGSLRLLTWNVLKEHRAGWDEDFHNMAVGADVVALQEAALDPRLEKLLTERGYAWNLSTAFHDEGARVGVLTAGQASAERDCSISTMEPLLRIPKQIVINEYAIAGRGERLLVANVHFVNFTLGTQRFRAQLNALRDILAQHPGPILLVGDFNTWSDARQAIVDELVDALALQTVGFPDDQRSRFLGQPVDHVFYRGLTAGAATAHRVSSSDHNPVTVDFSIDAPL